MPSSQLRTLLVGFAWAEFPGPGLPGASQSGCCVIGISTLTFLRAESGVLLWALSPAARGPSLP